MLNHLLDRDVVFFGGKGGVGKTTCSAAFALAASRGGRHVMLVSTDPAHSTSDIFEQKIGGARRELAPNLAALEIDADREASRYIAAVKADIERMFSPAVIRQAHRQIDMVATSPGLAEVALVDRMIDLILNQHERPFAEELIVFDTAPTGHTLQLLRMPDALTTWIQALARHRRALLEIDSGAAERVDQPVAVEQDPILDALERRHQRLMALRDRLTDRSRTAFVLVTNPERLAIEETARAADQLVDAGMHVGALIVNRILPDGLSGDFYVSRKAQEAGYLGELSRRFTTLPRTDVRQLARDVYGLDALLTVSRQLVS